MKRIMTALLLALASCAISARADEGVNELCRDLINSIAADDPVAYAQCYTTIRHRKSGMKKISPTLTDKDMQRIEDKFRKRNTTIRHSFRIIREQIADPKARMQFVSAEAKVKTEMFGNTNVTVTSSILCRFKVNEQEWVLLLDDGIFLDNRWFLSDDPVSLETPTKKIGFRPSGRDKDGRIIYGRVTKKE
jgi:hypothetical protein